MEGLTFHTRAATAGCSFDHRLTEEEPCKALPGLVSARGATCLPWQPCDLPASKPPIQTSLASIPGYDSPRGRTDRGRFRTSFSSRGPSPSLYFCSLFSSEELTCTWNLAFKVFSNKSQRVKQ